MSNHISCFTFTQEDFISAMVMNTQFREVTFLLTLPAMERG
jgi:hypothetical protein